jgi:hypothetical protein
MKAILSIAIFAIHVSAFIPLCALAEDAQLGKGKHEITCKGPKVTVRANEADAAQLLQDFSKKSGITFNKYVGKRKTVTLDLNGVKTEEFLNRVLGSYVATSKKKNGEIYINKVTIMDEEEHAAPAARVEKKPRERPRRSDREERARWRARRRRRATRKRKAAKPPPKSPEQLLEELTGESQPLDPADQSLEDPSQELEDQQPEQQLEQQPEPG